MATIVTFLRDNRVEKAHLFTGEDSRKEAVKFIIEEAHNHGVDLCVEDFNEDLPYFVSTKYGLYICLSCGSDIVTH